MKKKLIFLSLIVLTIVSCSKKVVDSQTKGESVDSHSAQTSIDSQGKKVTGELPDKYILKEDNLMGADTNSGLTNYPALQGLKYRLIELEGVPLMRAGKDLFIQFDKEGKFSAFVGCNQISGGYVTLELNKIQFSKIISTRMACENMSMEQQFLKFLGMTDVYIKEDQFLSLNKAGMTLLRFEKMN